MRADRWNEFGEVKRTIEARFAADNIQVAGRPWAAGQYVARLAAGAKDKPGAAIAPVPPDFELPATDEPLWQFRFQSKADPANPSQPFALQDDYGRARANSFPIPAATDGQRIYTNLFGVEMAFDLSTGKMIWRTGRLHQLNFQNQQGVRPERYGIAVIGERVWSVTRDPQQLNRSPPTFSLVARENATAKETFNSRRTLSSWNIMGLPIVVDGSFTPVANPTKNVASSAQESGASGETSTLDWSNGFSAGTERLSFNGTAEIVDSRLRLTSGKSKQVGSAFTKMPVSVAGFRTQFDFQITKPFADGIIFILQGDGPTGLGVWNNGRNGIAFEGIAKSVGVKFDIYGEDANSTGLCLDGIRPRADTAISLRGTKIDLKSGHVFRVNMTYDGENLDVTIKDTQTQASHNHSYSVDISSHVNGVAAHVGFMASSGLLTAVQEVANWTYEPTTPRKKAAAPVVEGVVYVVASRLNKSADLSLLVLDVTSGRLLKEIALGTYAVDPNQNYVDRPSQPSMLLSAGRLYVDTHAGALVSVDPARARSIGAYSTSRRRKTITGTTTNLRPVA